MASPFNPRDVEVLAAALPPEGVNQVGLLARSVLVLHAKRLTPGHYSQMIGTGPAFVTIFFPDANPNPLEASISPLTGLDDGFFSAVAVALLCRRMGDVLTSGLRPQILTAKADADLWSFSTRIRENSYRFYAEMAKYADSPIRTALAAFQDDSKRAVARQHYLAGLSSPTWTNDKMLQWSSGNWPDRDWELFNHYAKLTALGCSTAEIDLAIDRIVQQGLPIPPALRPGAWYRQAPWLADLRGEDAADATAALLKTNCHVYPGATYPSCIAEDNSYEFTASSQPGTSYRQVPSSSCFAPGTRVVMADGTLRVIEDVMLGDKVATPEGPGTVILRQRPTRGARILCRFEGTSFAFVASHPFMTAGGDAAYAAADPEALARDVPTLSQFGIRPLAGADLLRRTAHGTAEPFPAPPVHDAAEAQPDFLYDLYLAVGPDGRSEYFAGDTTTQLLVSSEVPRFAAAPATTAVVLHILEQAGPTILHALADVPDESFEDLLSIGLDSMTRTLIPTIGPELTAPASAAAPTLAPSAVADPEALAAAVRSLAASLAAVPDGYDRRMGVLVEQFAARFAPQFEAALTLPWRVFDLADADVTDVLALTLYNIETSRPGPPAREAQAELTLHQAGARATRRLPVRPGAPADRWYYSFDHVAYFPEWSPPIIPNGPLWQLDIEIAPSAGSFHTTLPLPADLAHGYQACVMPLRDPDGAVVGQTHFDIRLLTLDAYAAEVRRQADPPPQALPTRLAQLATAYLTSEFAQALSLFRFCAATTRAL
ncbi:hypothetical protein [Streptomyces sp. NPDC057426]|uniref:hypothetical protein n=1 Tax=Streptomyces sp. NPDC057426 TaxID=3346128 RepID=UPI0036C5CB6F